MSNRKLILLSILVASLSVGCAQPPTTGANQPGPSAVHASPAPLIYPQADTSSQGTVSAPEPNGVLTLGQALALTLMHNPQLKEFSLETRAAQARELQAGLWPNPELEVEVEGIGGTGELSGVESAETTFQLKQRIELGNKAQKRRAVASFESRLAHLNYQSQRTEIFTAATKAFFRVLAAQEKLLLSSELLALSEESFQTVQMRVDAGKDSPVEKARATVAVANIRILHRQTQRHLQSARRQLVSFWASDRPSFHQAVGDLHQLDQLPADDELIDQLRLNPQYARWEAEIDKRRAALDLAETKALGDITLKAALQRFNESEDNAFVLGLSIPLPLFDRNQGSRQEAVHNLAKSKQRQRTAWLALQNEFHRTYQSLADSHAQLNSLHDEVLPAATEVFHAANRAYREGKVDYLNVLDAQRTLVAVKNDYIESLTTYHTAKTDIERLTGGPITGLNLSESE